MINILTGGSGSGGALRLLAYLPFVKMAINPAVGLSKKSDGTTNAEGTLYPTDLNTSSNVGSINSFAGQMAGYSLGTTDDLTPGNNVTKTFVGENYFSKYKRFKYAKLNVALKWRQAISTPGGDSNSIPHKFVELDSTRGVLFFKVAGSGYYAQVIQRDGSNNFTFGSAVQLDNNNSSADMWYLDAVKVNTDKIIFIHSQTTNVRAMSISGTTITLGSGVAYAAGGDAEVTIAFVDNDKAIIGFNESNDGKARIVTVSGTTCTVNTNVSMGENAKQVYVQPNSTSKAQVTYYVGTQQKTRVLSISGTTITAETAATVGSTGEHGSKKEFFRKIASDKFLLFTTGATGKAWIISVSGTSSSVASSTLTQGSILGDQYNGLIEITAGTLYHLYQITDNNSYKKVRTLTISGTSVTDSNIQDISSDVTSNGQIINIDKGTSWKWGSDVFLWTSGRSFGSWNGFYGYMGKASSHIFEFYNNGVIIGSAKTVDYNFTQPQYDVDVAITTGKKCYFGIKNTSATASYLGMSELLVEVE